MILDTMENAKQYAGLNPDLDRILEAMKAYTPDNYPGGRIELDGSRLFMLLKSYETHALGESLSEAHRNYLDVMYMVEGEETIYVKPTAQLKNVTKEYDPAIEALLAKTDEDVTPVLLKAGSFVVLFPQDAHTPACHANGPCMVKKIIGKVQIG
ncbi:MAG: YhcH/YjgK/YiaL family protein [Oscillospiraceae bacterium]|nr:YhcH/YjgK/YiaL family protein [Oscillospiraceae bacterium]